MTGIEIIEAERARQVTEEVWTPEHDDEHDNGALALAAAVYALPADRRDYETRRSWTPGIELEGRGDHTWEAPRLWPWDEFKPTPDDRVRELAKAGALIAAEIDRLQWDAS